MNGKIQTKTCEQTLSYACTTLHHQVNAFTCLLVKFNSPRFPMRLALWDHRYRILASDHESGRHYVHDTSVDSPSRAIAFHQTALSFI